MAGFKIVKNHSMSKADIRDAAEELAQQMSSEYGLRYRWQGDSATFGRSGLDGQLKIEDDALVVSVKLGLLASAFEKPLRKAVDAYLDEHLS